MQYRGRDTKSHSSPHCVDPHYVSGLRYTYRLDVMRIVQRPIFCEGALVVGSSTHYRVRLRRLLLPPCDHLECESV